MLGQTRQLEKALMLPLIILSLASLVSRIAQPDISDVGFISLLAEQLIHYVPLMMALGLVAVYSKGFGHVSVVTGVVSYLSLEQMMLMIGPNVQANYAVGGVSALIALVSLRYCRKPSLPPWLRYFEHKHLAPILAAILSGIAGGILGIVWPFIEQLLVQFSSLYTQVGILGLFVEGVFSRLVVPLGLHYSMSDAYWHHLIFPVVTFALPLVVVAMYKVTLGERKVELLGLFLLFGLCAFLTGNSDAIEIVLLITSPLLFLVHALLTGIVIIIASLIGGFSGNYPDSGGIDFLLYFHALENPVLFLSFSIVTGIFYGFTFYILIQRLALQEDWASLMDDDEVLITPEIKLTASPTTLIKSPPPKKIDLKLMAEQCLSALGGAKNLEQFDACITRIRMTLKQRQQINEDELKRLGAKGVVKLGEHHLQVIFGPVAENLAVEMKLYLNQHQDKRFD